MNKHAQQPALITALLRPEAYPHPAGPCELIETHISWVILAGEFAYKIKKPLNLGFLNFSTLEKRRHYCEEELRLNRRLAPSLYLDVVSIGGKPQTPQLNVGEGVIEYAVRMRRFSQQSQLDCMLERGELELSHMDAFARMAVEFHATVAVAGEAEDYGTPHRVWQPVEENFQQIRQHLTGSEHEPRLAELERWSGEQFSRLKGVLQERKSGGFIRECHGDMHLRNLAWIDNRAVAFDCIEFNPALRWIDVISEIAFLVMDLQERGQSRLAQRFLNTYLETGGDYKGLTLLPFYLVYRALVRAKVAAIRAAQSDLSDDEQTQAMSEFSAYLAMAQRYTQRPKPFILIARGMSASGKTTLTGPLLEQLGAIRLRSDVERKRLFGLRAEDDGSAATGEGIYTAAASKQTYERLAGLAAVLLQAGFPVIIDAVCMQRAQREYFYRVAIQNAVPYLLLEFEAPIEELKQRIISRIKGASDADLAVLQQQSSNWETLDEDEKDHALIVDSGRDVSEAELLAQVREHL